MKSPSPLLLELGEIAQKAGRMAQEIRGTASREFKGDGSIVTEADRATETWLREVLPALIPGTNFAGEEFGYDEPGPEGLWIVDPVDGTSNFSFGSPLWAVSIGLLKDGVPVLGAIFAPDFNELYLAERGKGAFLNGRQLPMLEPGEVKRHELVVCNENVLRYVGIEKVPGKMRCCGAAVIDSAWVAAGRNRAMIGYNERLHDLCASLAINLEVGAQFRLMNGEAVDLNALCTGEMIGKPWILFPPDSRFGLA
jgi:myo-inositol-1(or 4)-monophosphatase